MLSDVLVLNRNFYAIHIADWQRALSLVYLDHARVVDQEYRTYSFDDWRELSKILENHPAGFVSTPTFRIAVPEVIALRTYDKLPVGDVKFTRRNIYEHYGYRCCYCGRRFGTPELNLEHVLPHSRGGKTDWSNIVTSCIPCNLKKADRLPVEAGMKLLIKPSKPKWRGSASLVFKAPFKIRASWQRFVDTVYWNTELEP
ncbi:MAG: HNH endonuclease [Elusimicrobiota bacterium]|jgi:5-methylcytosine-specific restriction endonuclease McrA